MFLRWRIWLVYAVLFAFAVPWYWGLLPHSTAVRLVYGAPLWAVVSVLGSFLISLFTAALLYQPWEGEEADAAPKG